MALQTASGSASAAARQKKKYLKRAMRSADDGRSSVSPHPPVEDEDERDSESDAARSRTSSTAEKTSDVPDIMADMAPCTMGSSIQDSGAGTSPVSDVPDSLQCAPPPLSTGEGDDFESRMNELREKRQRLKLQISQRMDRRSTESNTRSCTPEECSNSSSIINISAWASDVNVSQTATDALPLSRPSSTVTLSRPSSTIPNLQGSINEMPTISYDVMGIAAPSLDIVQLAVTAAELQRQESLLQKDEFDSGVQAPIRPTPRISTPPPPDMSITESTANMVQDIESPISAVPLIVNATTQPFRTQSIHQMEVATTSIGTTSSSLQPQILESNTFADEPIITIPEGNILSLDKLVVIDNRQTTAPEEIEAIASESSFLERELEALRSKIHMQARTNQELKRLLVAAFGPSLSQEISHLTSLKVEQADKIEELSQTKDRLEVTLSEAVIGRDLYQSKFSAAEVMIHEPTKAETQLSAMLEESNRQLSALQTSQTNVIRMVNDCTDLLMAVVTRLTQLDPNTHLDMGIDPQEAEGVLETARDLRRSGQIEEICESSLMLVGMSMECGYIVANCRMQQNTMVLRTFWPNRFARKFISHDHGSQCYAYPRR